MKKEKGLFLVLILLFWGGELMFAQNSTNVALEGTWTVTSMRQGTTFADESAMKRNNLEYDVIIEKNIGMMIRIVNGVATSGVRFEVVGNTMRDEIGGKLPYSLNNGILTISFPNQNLVITCRKKQH